MRFNGRWQAVLAAAFSLLGHCAAAAPAAGAAARGARIYERCMACHALETDRTGPRHCGLIGRRAGSVPDFAYSPAMREAKMVWTETNLDRFLESPLAAVPGTAMGYDGIKDAGERRDLIAYLRAAGRGPACRGKRFSSDPATVAPGDTFLSVPAFFIHS